MKDAYLNAARRNVFRNELAHKKTERGHLERRFVRPRRELSEKGAGAQAIYDMLEPEPLWLTLYRQAAHRLPKTGKRVLEALEQDWRTAVAARIASVSRPTVDLWKNKFQNIFAQCFRAYERDFGQKRLFAF